MGKTAAGAVWLNADMVSPYDYWQYWRNIEDGDVTRFLKLFTMLPLDEIARLAASKAPRSTRPRRFWPRKQPRSCMAAPPPSKPPAPHARRSKKARSLRNLPTVEIARAEFDNGLGVLTAFAEKTGLVASNGEARRADQGRRVEGQRRTQSPTRR